MSLLVMGSTSPSSSWTAPPHWTASPPPRTAPFPSGQHLPLDSAPRPWTAPAPPPPPEQHLPLDSISPPESLSRSQCKGGGGTHPTGMLSCYKLVLSHDTN